MDALLLTNDTYVCEQYHDIEVERHRKHHVAPAHKAGGHPGPWPNGANHHATMHIPKQIRSQTQQQAMQRVHALDALSCVSHLDKKLAVLQAILSDVQQNSADAWAVAPDEEEEAGSAVNATAATTTTLHDSILKEAFNPVPFKELSLPLQLGLRLFFRVCQSFRDPAKLSSSYRMLVPVASKIPEIVAALPLIPLSPGLIDSPVDDDDATGHANSLAGESEPKVYSVFQELFQLLSSLLDLPTTTNAASAMGTATQGDRAILLTAYIALSLKWGRMQHLLVAIQMLLDSSSGLSSAQLEQLAPVLQELACATAELGPSIQREEDVCSGILMSFGKGDHGKLGHGQCNHASCPEGNCTENKNSPTILVATRDVQFVKIDSLSTHSVAITTKGEVMAWGNGDKYRLGHGTTAKEYTPRTIDFLSAKGRVTDIACGLGHTIALLSNGEMYAWGNGSNGRLGLGDTNDRSAPTRVPLPDVVDNSSGGNARALAAVFRSVYCGASHSLGVTRDGRAFAWGKNNQGQCGHGHTNDVYTIEEIRYFPDEADELVAHAAGGWEHTLFCTTSGRVYSCGCGYKDSRRTGIPPVLGHGDCDRRLKPAVVQALVDQNEEAVRVACGWDHSMAVTAQGAVYSWGSGSNGKLGHNDEENYDVPTLIRALEGKTVKDAKAGCEHSVLLTDQNEVFTCGQGDSGRLGHGDAQTRKVPTLIESFADGGLEPVAIAVGDKYNLVLVEDISHTGNAAKDSAGSPRRAPPVSPASRKKASLTTLKHHDPAIVQAYRDRALVRDIQNQFIWGEATKENEANPKCLLIEAIEALCQRRHKSDTVNPEESRDSVLVHKNNVELAGAMLGHMERIAVGYLADEKLGLVGSSMGNSPKGGRAQALLPFAVDTSCESLQSLLGLLRTLAAGVMTDSKGKNDTPSDCQMKALRGPMLLASLRILKTNLDVIVHQHGGEKGRIPSGLALSCAASGKKSSSSDLEMSALFHDLHDFLGSLARSRQEGIVKSLSPVADESKLLFETRKLHQVAAEITEESAQALKVGFGAFFPAHNDRRRLLSELLLSSGASSHSMHTVILADRFCEDDVMQELLAQLYVRKQSSPRLSSHRCSSDGQLTTDSVRIQGLALAGDGGRALLNTDGQIPASEMLALISCVLQQCSQRALNQLDDDQTTPGGVGDMPGVFLRLLTVFQTHLFSTMLIHLAKRGANVEENQAELSEAGDMPDVCGCVVDHALVYLELLLHEAFVVLKRLHKATCHHEEAISWRLNGSFLHQLLPNAIQNMCVLLAQASTSTILEPDNMTHPPLALQFVDRIVPLLHPMLKMLDEVNWKLQSTNNNNQTHHETSDVATMLADSSHDNRNWVGELEDVCAMLCGKLCGVLVEHGHADPFTGQSSLSKAHRWIVDSLLGTSMIPKYSRADAVSEALPDAVSNILKWESLCVFEVENELPTSEDAADGAVMHTAPKDPAALQSRLAEWLDVQDIESMLLSMVLEQAGDTVREQVDRLPDGHRRALSTCVVGVTAAAVWNLGLVDALAVLLPHQQEVDNATSIDSSEALTSLLQVASNVLESIVGAKLPLSVHLKTAAAWTIAEPNPTVFAPLLAGGEPATSLINTVLVSLESPMDLVVAKQVMGWHDVQASLFRIGLGSFHDLLRKLTISSSKARLLGELTAVLARRQSLVPDELASLAMQQKHIDKTVENLYIRVAKVLTSEDSSVELKKKALVVWSAPLKIHDAEGKNSSTALAAKAGIVGILAELLHDDTPQDPKLTWGRLATVSSSCSSANQHLEAHALMFPSYTMGRPTHERADASHGHRLPPKLKAVESILFHQGSNEVLAAMAWEALCSVAMDFCTSAAFHQRDTLPLLSHGAAVPQASSRPSSAKDVTAPQRVITLSPRKRLTLPKKVVVSTEEETIDQLYDGLFSLLRRSCYDLEQQQDVIKHLTTLVIPVTPGADTAQPFLLGNPLCVGATTAQTVRSGAPAGPVRMSPATSSSDGTEKGWSVAFWVCVDQCTCREACKQFPTDRSPEQAPNPFVCIAAFGRDANKKTLLSEQEGTNATLNEDDPVDVIVFTHQLWSDRVILAVAVRAVGDDVDTSRGGEAAVPAGSSDGWTTHVIGETIRVGEWMHIAIVSCESDQRGSLTVYVDAKPVMTNAVCPATTPTRWTRMKAGGALSDSLIQRLALTPQPAVSSSSPSARTSVFAAVLDDVLVSSRPLQTQYIQLLSKEGPLLAQLRRQFTVNQSALAITKLLFEMMLHSPDLPAKSVQTSPSQHSTRWINALLSLLAVSDPDSLTQFYVLELLRRVLPRVHPSDSQTGLEVLKAVAKTIRDDAATSNGETTTAMPAITTARDVLWLVNSTFSKLPRSLQSFETLRQVLDQKGMLMTSAPNSMVTSDQPIRQSTAVRCTSLRRVFGIRLLQALWAAPTWSSCSSQFNTMATENVRRQLEAAKFADSIDECTDLAHALVFSSGGYCELSANQLSAMLLSHTPILLALTPYELPLQSPVGRLITDAQGAFLHAAKLLVTQAMAPGSRVVTARQDKKDATRDVQPVAYASATLLRMKSSVMRFLMMHASSLSSELVQDEELWKCLYQSATSMLVDAMSACLGVDSKTIAKLPLVNQLMHELQGKEGQRLSAVALSELEALEWETWEACAALHGQRLPWWLPRHGAASAASCLEALGGEVEIREFSVKAIEHFPTVKLGKVAITAGSGLWYFEVLMLTDGLMQIGYIDNEFVADAVQGQGVGDHNSSWAFDGFRRKKWNVNSYDYGDAWHTGDVVGVLLDTDRMELSYFLNGKFLGVAFTALPISATSLLYPAASLNADQIIQFNFGVAGANADLSKGPLDLTQMFVHVPMLDSDVDQSRLQPVVLAMGGTGEDSATALALTAQRVGMVEDGEVNEDEDGGASDDDDDEDDTGEQAGHADHTARSSSYAIREGMFAIGDDTAASDAHTLLLLAAGGSMRDTTQHSIPHDARLMYMIDDANSSDHVSRRNELIDGLTSIGLPRDWAIRCVTETTLSANKGSAVSWILEQMEKEFLSMPDSSISLLQALAQHSSSTTSSASSLSLAASRSADDLALLPSMVSSVVHPPSMFPTHAHSMLSRNYRPQTEQVTRSRGQHPFLFPADSSGSTEAKVPTTNNNPFLKAELEDAAVASESSWGARGSREGRYRRFGEVSMIRRILGHHSDIMGKVAEGERVKSSTVEELMQLWVATNSALCVVYARRCLWSLLLSATQDVSIPCTRLHDALLPANATYDERKRLVRFSRILLHLDPREAVDGMSDVDVTSHNSHVSIQLRAAMQQLLVTELENLPKSDANDHEPNTQSPDAVVSQMPIFHVLFEELNQQILHALATATMGRVDPSAEDAMATMANNAAWSLWVGTLLMTFAHDQLVKSDGVTPSPPFPAIPAASCWSIAFLQALMALAAAPSVVSTPWKVVALELMRHVVSSSQAVDSQSTWQSWFAFPSSVIMELVQVENLLDLLALRLRKEKSANVLASDLTQSLFRSLNAVFKAPVIHSLTLTPPPSTPLEVLVENLTASQVTVSWKRTETQEEETAVAQANEDDPPTETNIDSVALVSLEIVEVPVVRGEAWIQDEQKPLERVVLPRKGTYTVRNLAPDTMYVVRVKELPANGQEDSALEAKEALLQASVTFSTPQEPLFELDRDAMGKNLVLFNQNLSARNLMNKKWHTVRTTVAFEEGVHQWQVRIDKCVSKNIFVGVCTQQANLENYIGSDAFGYGFLANKAVWHNKTKLHSYGEIFKQGDLLQVTLDCNAKTLAFSRNGDYLGLAATNMHVPGGSTTDGTRCKWYPAFSMYNKDDQLTIIPPSPAASVSKIGRQQNVSVLQLVDSMRVLQMHNTSASAPERVPDVTHTHVLASAFAFWQRWKRGEALVRETEQGRYIVLDAREAITAKYGYAQGDVVFTGKGQCTVLGEHNHVLYYELEDGVGGSTITSAPVLQLNAWTLHACKEMQRSSSDFPVHRRPRGRFFELTEPSESASPPQTASPDDDDPSVLSAFVKAQQAWDSSLDGSLMAVLSQVAANRAVKDLWHVTYNDLHNAQELTEFAASVTVGSSDGLDDRKCLVMDRVAWLLFVNQHIYNVVSVALSDLPDPRATCALQVVGRTDKGTPRALNDVNPQHMVAQVLAATRFVTQTMETLDLVHGLPTVARWAKTLMLEGQKAQLLDRFICSTATNSVTFDAPRSPAESTAGEDGASTGASGLATIHVRLHEPGIIPFWRSPSLATVFTSYAIPPEALEDNGASMFVHVSRQLANIDAVELRRQCAMPFDSFPITRSLQFTIMNRSTAKSKSTGQSKELTGHQNAFDAQFGGDVDLLDHHPLQEPMQNAADQCLQYLQVFEELMKEVQSPAFPLFVPRRPDPTLQLRINTDLFKSTSLLTMQLSHDQVLVWFYHFGQLLGTAWRNKLVLPLQFLDERVWDLVLDPCFQDDVKAQQRGLDAWEQHTEHTAINAIRDGVFSIVPSRCAHLMTGASLRRRIVDRHVTLISDLEHIAVFDKNSATHQLFWRVVRQFTSLERQMLLQFLTGKYHHRANASATTSLPVLDLQDSLPDSHDHPDACYPIVEPVSAALTRLYLPAYSTEAVLRRKLTLAMTNLPML